MPAMPHTLSLLHDQEDLSELRLMVGRLGELDVPTTKKGYESLISSAAGFGRVRCADVEGTSSDGAGLTRAT